MPRALKSIRKEKGLSLMELARLSGVGASTIGNWENGKTEMSMPSLKKIAGALGASIEEIFGEKDCLYVQGPSMDLPQAVAERPRTIEDRLEAIESGLRELTRMLSESRKAEGTPLPNVGKAK